MWADSAPQILPPVSSTSERVGRYAGYRAAGRRSLSGTPWCAAPNRTGSRRHARPDQGRYSVDPDGGPWLSGCPSDTPAGGRAGRRCQSRQSAARPVPGGARRHSRVPGPRRVPPRRVGRSRRHPVRHSPETLPKSGPGPSQGPSAAFAGASCRPVFRVD